MVADNKRSAKRNDKMQKKASISAENKSKALAKAVKKAIDAKVASKVGNKRKHVQKIRTKPRFYARTDNMKQAKKPKAIHKSSSRRSLVNEHNTLQDLISTEAAMREVERGNCLVFNVNVNATKLQIKDAFQKNYNIKLVKVRTARTIKGKKKAFCKLPMEIEAFELASKLSAV